LNVDDVAEITRSILAEPNVRAFVRTSGDGTCVESHAVADGMDALSEMLDLLRGAIDVFGHEHGGSLRDLVLTLDQCTVVAGSLPTGGLIAVVADREVSSGLLLHRIRCLTRVPERGDAWKQKISNGDLGGPD